MYTNSNFYKIIRFLESGIRVLFSIFVAVPLAIGNILLFITYFVVTILFIIGLPFFIM